MGRGGGGGLKVISPLDGGGQEVILTLIQGVQLYFKAYFANFRTPPPLQIIIAQSLMNILIHLRLLGLYKINNRMNVRNIFKCCSVKLRKTYASSL